jgi:hypothetical protein
MEMSVSEGQSLSDAEKAAAARKRSFSSVVD